MERKSIQILKHILLFLLIICSYSLRLSINSKTGDTYDSTTEMNALHSIETPQAYLLGVTSLKYLLDENWLRRDDLKPNSAFELGQIRLMKYLSIINFEKALKNPNIYQRDIDLTSRSLDTPHLPDYFKDINFLTLYSQNVFDYSSI